MSAVPQSAAQPAPTARAVGTWRHARTLVPGTALACVLALAASFVSSLHGGPQLLYALLFGVASHYPTHEAKTKPGIEFSGRAVLRLGVGRIGAPAPAAPSAGRAWEPALTVVAGLASSL